MHPVQNIVDDVYICGPKNSIRHPGSDDTGLTRTFKNITNLFSQRPL